ncbi:PREDICTED: cAMP-specific 3',5'-cyclic phosphodiesterase 4C-like isoform X1 [Amphimedon queenslandica]|uniref:Phosphodiesterase n=2 Tax=Amphimedon queenslandica TaxID=400682 RepID=A0AAN0JDT1_AMPQE|nr:PREDICTED: cAMP-specific 3',5'-cyclic phosphodiesterase 4C-like isoform X1 [Amphimedon queenslandica]|eukprot:XP_019855180.1 PREDICTED: cAMP-specific 3',5'-cyclic phosphodiesterase 4C-like isoform X1 [Amphimedon queenslandica]
MSDSTEDNSSASPGEDPPRRKSVTFRLPVSSRSWDEGITSYQLEEDEEEVVDEESEMPMDSPVVTRPNRLLDEDRYYRRGSSGTIESRGMNRSRSVIIRLQVPRGQQASSQRAFRGESANEDQFRGRSTTYSGPPTSGGSSPSSFRRVPSPMTTRAPLRATREGQLSPVTSEVEVSLPPEKEGGAEGGTSDEELPDLSPTFARSNPHLFSSRRNSFLYQSDNEDSPPLIVANNPMSRASSISSHLQEEGASPFVTPFAQILATLYRIRAQYIKLTHPPISDHRRRSRGSGLDVVHEESEELSPEEYQALALTTLDELDWCLHRLETVNSAKSVGNMAQDKFKRLLSRELSHMSERSRSGQFVAEWVSTITGNAQDRSDEIDKALESLSVVDTSLGLEVAKTKGRLSAARSTSVTDQVARFGVVSVFNEEKLQAFINNSFHRWEFDAFELNFLTLEQPLVVCAYTIFTHRGLFVEFKMSKTNFLNFMVAIENTYWKQNPYHNSIHAADVMQAVNYLLNATVLENVFSPLEILAVLIAAAVHDVDHPGTTNQFLINSNDDLAIMYNDESILENHHLAVAFKLLNDPSCNFLGNIEKAQMKALRKVIIDTVLATDMSKHFQHLGELKTMVETKMVTNGGVLQVEKYSDRSEHKDIRKVGEKRQYSSLEKNSILQCLVHCADLSNTAKPVEIASQWAHRIMEESFKQGDQEKKLGLDISPLGDRDNVSIEKCQVTFIDYIVFPLWETWGELVYPDAQVIIDHLSRTRDYWYQRSLKIEEEEGEEKEKEGAKDGAEGATPELLSPEATKQRRLSYKTAKNNMKLHDSIK